MNATGSALSALKIDDSSWPVVVLEMRDGMTDDDWLAMFAFYEKLYRRAERFCPITDGSKLTRIPSASTRSLISKLTKEHEPRSRARILHSYAVAGSELTRGLLTALNWLSPPVYPLLVVSSVYDAKLKACQVLTDAGYAVPEPLRSELALAPR